MRLPLLALLVLLAVRPVLAAEPALAQTGGAPAQAVAQIEKLAEAARRDGMVVVVMTPGAAAVPMPMTAAMRTERFLAARTRLRDVFASAATLPQAITTTLARINALSRAEEGYPPWLWLLRGLATAALGGLVGWLALRPVVGWARRAARRLQRPVLGRLTTADKALRLLRKIAIAVTFATLIFLVALLVAVVLDSGFEPTRRVIFECLAAFLVYRLLRFAFAWPLTAYDDAPYRLVGLSDVEARELFGSFALWSALVLVPLTVLRFFILEGDDEAYGALGPDHTALLVIVATGLATLAVIAFVLINRRAMGDLLMPQPPDAATDDRAVEGPVAEDPVAEDPVAESQVVEDRAVESRAVESRAVESHGAAGDAVGPEVEEGVPSPALRRLRVVLARALPAILIAYSAFALLAFLFRLGLGLPAPAATIAAPFAIGYVALAVYGLLLGLIQLFYDGRARRFRERIARERRLAAQEAARARADLREGEEMMLSHGAAMGDAPTLSPDMVLEYRPLLRGFLERAALAIVVTVALGELGRWWGVPVGEEGNSWAALLDMVLAIALAWIAYRAITLAIARRLEEEAGPEIDEEAMGEGGGAGASRMATLLPIIRWVLVAVVVVAAVIVVLSRFGLDIGPLLASAGVVGIAVGFGAQKLIQDIFSGAFFLMDDAFRRGEYVEIEGVKGTVEKISIRSFQLRHHLGALHTIPFGEIKQLTNYSRDWVLMKLPLRVTYDTDVERVRKLVKKLGQELLEHPEVGHTFMQPLKSQGVYRMEDSAMIIRVKFMTKPGEQFVTRKVVYAAIQELFAREGIRFAHKEVTVRLADGEVDALTPQQRRAVTSAAREVVDAEEAEAAAGELVPAGR